MSSTSKAAVGGKDTNEGFAGLIGVDAVDAPDPAGIEASAAAGAAGVVWAAMPPFNPLPPHQQSACWFSLVRFGPVWFRFVPFGQQKARHMAGLSGSLLGDLFQ
jgi:hypothetical protein